MDDHQTVASFEAMMTASEALTDRLFELVRKADRYPWDTLATAVAGNIIVQVLGEERCPDCRRVKAEQFRKLVEGALTLAAKENAEGAAASVPSCTRH
jgi:hypothetical protein